MQGVPLTRWSLDRLSAYLAEHGVLISPIDLWRLLDQAGLSFPAHPLVEGQPRSRL
jgi:hypothetical protein